MSVNSYLENLASSLVLSGNEKEGITKSLNTIKERIGNYFSNVTEKKVFGSYVRETILPRKADENSDIDLMVVFENPNGYKPQSFLNQLKTFVETYYSHSEIYQSNPTIVLELNHIKFELVPAQINYGQYYIPMNSSEWQYTDPDGFHTTLLECNKINGYRIKPVIRLVKHWNIQKNEHNLASYALEKKIAEELKYMFLSCSSYTDYTVMALEAIKYQTSYNRVTAALDHIKQAIEFEDAGYPYSALAEIKKAFPEV